MVSVPGEAKNGFYWVAGALAAVAVYCWVTGKIPR